MKGETRNQPDPEINDGNTEPEDFSTNQEAACREGRIQAVNIIEKHAFGNLKLKPLWLHLCAGKRLGDNRGQARIDKLQRRNIDRNPD